MADTRYSDLAHLLGAKCMSQVRTSKILMVGAGGIGCELLKELVMAGFGEIHIVDLDTIDLSNLNRQFLFSRQHVKQSKAFVAAEVAGKFNPDVHIIPYVQNIITSAEFTPNFFRSFNVVFNALDNAEARRHVNKMCVATNVPLIDCGSAGFAGQVQVILPTESECYDCRSHPTPTSFPVCTIRSTPSQPIHCVVWSKSFLFALLFGPPNEEDVEEEETPKTEEEKKELEKLKVESNELADLKTSLQDPDFMAKMVQKVYITDVERLLMAPEMWKSSGKPLPKPLDLKLADTEPIDPEDLDEHQLWDVPTAMGVLKFVTNKLISRIQSVPAIEFDKDDEDTMDFVAAATILRSHIFSIEQKTRFELKQMAGNIIPAVASTNAIVSGLGVIEAMKLCDLKKFRPFVRDVDIFRDTKTAIIGDKLQPPDPECQISNAARTFVKLSSKSKLEDLVEKVLKDKLGYQDFSLVTDKLIYDPDFDDQLSKSLSELNLVNKFVTVLDDDDRKVNLQLLIEEASDNEIHMEDFQVPLRPEIKRSRSDDEDEGDDLKKLKTDSGEAASVAPTNADDLKVNADGDIELLDDDIEIL